MTRVRVLLERRIVKFYKQYIKSKKSNKRKDKKASQQRGLFCFLILFSFHNRVYLFYSDCLRALKLSNQWSARSDLLGSTFLAWLFQSRRNFHLLPARVTLACVKTFSAGILNVSIKYFVNLHVDLYCSSVNQGQVISIPRDKLFKFVSFPHWLTHACLHIDVGSASL